VFDASYFKNGLADQITATGGKATVEVHLVNAHTHRVRSVIDAEPGHVVLEAFRQRVDGGRADQYWEAVQPADGGSHEVARIVVAYESIAEIVITPADDASMPRIGFVRQ
jgi:hypothetical protein